MGKLGARGEIPTVSFVDALSQLFLAVNFSLDFLSSLDFPPFPTLF